MDYTILSVNLPGAAVSSATFSGIGLWSPIDDSSLEGPENLTLQIAGTDFPDRITIAGDNTLSFMIDDPEGNFCFKQSGGTL